MCFSIRTRRSEQGTWDDLGPSTCYYTKIAGGSTLAFDLCLAGGLAMVHGGTADAPWVTKADYNNAGMVLCVMFTLYWTGLWWEEPSSQLHFQEDPKSCGSNQQHFWKKSRKGSLSHWMIFLFPHWGSITKTLKTDQTINWTYWFKTLKKRCLPKAFSVQMP